MKFIPQWFSDFRRRRAIKKYAKKLGPALRKNYGKSRYYSPGQIKTAAKKNNLSNRHICYGYAMYMDRESFTKLHDDLGKECNYEAMRQEIGDLCFSGDSSFSTSDAMNYGGYSSDFSGGSDYGGDSGSD